MLAHPDNPEGIVSRPGKPGKDDEVDCREVLAEVYLFLDDECDEIQQATIKQHLDECYPCLQKFGIEQEIKAILAKKCGGDIAPKSLRASLKIKLSQVIVEDL